MTKCKKCGESSSEYAGNVREKAACTAAGCKGGKIRCHTCIWFPNGTMAKCCEVWECNGTGKRTCKTCNGKGWTHTYLIKCDKTHRKQSSPPGGRS